MELKTTNFGDVIIGDKQPVLVDFWAQWCGPCRMLAPVIEQVKETFGDQLLVGKVNVDDEQELAEKYRISSIPTVLIMRDGEVVERLVGARPYEDLEAHVRKHLETK